MAPGDAGGDVVVVGGEDGVGGDDGGGALTVLERNGCRVCGITHGRTC